MQCPELAISTRKNIPGINFWGFEFMGVAKYKMSTMFTMRL